MVLELRGHLVLFRKAIVDFSFLHSTIPTWPSWPFLAKFAILLTNALSPDDTTFELNLQFCFPTAPPPHPTG